MGSWQDKAEVLAQVPPRQLAEAVVRRAARNVRSAIAALQEPPTDAELLGAFRVQTTDQLAQVLAAPRLRAHWSDAGRAPELRELAQQLPGLEARVVARAERILANRFEIFGREVSFPDGGVHWRRDPVTGFTFAGPGESSALPQAGSGDPKRVWALARMDWAVALAQAAWLLPARAGQFAAKFAELTDSLLREAPAGQGIHSAAPMEVSLRAMNLALALSMFRGQPALDGAFLLRALRALTEHARFTLANLEDAGAVPNNHLIGDLLGLLHVGLLFPELPGASAWRDAAVDGLAQAYPAQVLPDGMGFEGSVGYHRLLLELGVAALALSRAAGVPLAAQLAPVLDRMFLASRGYLVAGQLAPNLGDNDSGRALPLCEREALDHGYLPPLGAALLHDARLKAPGAAFPDEAAWLTGRAGFDAFRELPETGGAGSLAFQHFGLAVLRRGPRALALSAGPTGQNGVGGHGHNDELAVELWSDGQPVIVDAGTWTYGGDPRGRDRFRGTAMHSTVQVDGAEQSPIVPGRPFALPDRAGAELCELRCTADRDAAAGLHRGYARLLHPVEHRREVSLESAADAALIVDELSGRAVHALTSRFHLGVAEARIRPLDGVERARLSALSALADWDMECAVEIGPAEAPLAVWVGVHGPRLRLAESAYSPGYDQRRPSLCIEVSLTARLPVRLAAAVLFTRGEVTPHQPIHPA